MTDENKSIIDERIEALEAETYQPEEVQEAYTELLALIKQDPEQHELFNAVIKAWQKDLLESYQCVDKLQGTIIQYEDELTLMMEQMDALVKCSVLIKQYSFYLKQEIDKVADKIDRQGFDSRIDQLVELLDSIQPKNHLSVVKEAKILSFPKKD